MKLRCVLSELSYKLWQFLHPMSAVKEIIRLRKSKKAAHNRMKSFLKTRGS